VLHTPGLRAVVLKTYGSGNAPQKQWFVDALKDATQRGIIIINISQCTTGSVEMERYETGLHLLDAGVISGYDSTVESVLTKLMFLLGHDKSPAEIRYDMNHSVAGEFTK
jgi:L-asparaginase